MFTLAAISPHAECDGRAQPSKHDQPHGKAHHAVVCVLELEAVIRRLVVLILSRASGRRLDLLLDLAQDVALPRADLVDLGLELRDGGLRGACRREERGLGLLELGQALV